MCLVNSNKITNVIAKDQSYWVSRIDVILNDVILNDVILNDVILNDVILIDVILIDVILIDVILIEVSQIEVIPIGLTRIDVIPIEGTQIELIMTILNDGLRNLTKRSPIGVAKWGEENKGDQHRNLSYLDLTPLVPMRVYNNCADDTAISTVVLDEAR